MYIVLLLFFVNNSAAQIVQNVPSVDKKTYELYLAKDWDKLIKIGKNALRNGIDFYYLNYRLGIAYYEKQNYAQAIKYFKKVNLSNPNDDTIKEYLYYSYLLSSRYDDARLLGNNFSDKMKKRLGIRIANPFFSAIHLSAKFDIVEDYTYTSQSNEKIDQQVVQKQSWYSFGAEHLIGNNITLMGVFSKTNIENAVNNTNPDLPEKYTGKVNQNQYYVSLKYHLGNGFNTALGLHYLSTELYAPTTRTQGNGKSRNFNLYSYKEKSFVVSANISKSFSIFNATLETSIANLNNKTQIQPSLSLRIYPFGNNTFFLETKGIYIAETDGVISTNYSTIKQSFGFKIKKYSFISPSITYGELLNFTDFNAFIVNNDIDKTKLRIENYINIGFNEGYFNVFFNYRYNIKENTYKINNANKAIDYNSQNILLGIKWYF